MPPHDSKSMRRTRGIEATLIDNSKMLIRALDPAADARQFEVSVAGPAALLVAKLHKIHDRIDEPSRQDNKDAHDVYLLRAVETQVLVDAIGRLLDDEASAEELVGDPTAVSESVALLAQDLLEALNF